MFPYDSLNMGLHVGDISENVIENREKVFRALDLSLNDLVTCKQVHEGNVTVVTRDMKGRGAYEHDTAIESTDALITQETGLCIGVMLADCVPVILFDPVRHAVGVAHSGWKGTVCGVTTNTLLKMGEVFGTEPIDVIAGIGPSIGPDMYEVGPEVVEQAEQAFPGGGVVKPLESGKGLFDLWEANRLQLIRLGVVPHNIELAGISSYNCSDIFFSDRKQRPTGRFMTAAMLR